MSADYQCVQLRLAHDHINKLASTKGPPDLNPVRDDIYRALRSMLLDSIDAHTAVMPMDAVAHHMLCPLRDPSSPYTTFTLRSTR